MAGSDFWRAETGSKSASNRSSSVIHLGRAIQGAATGARRLMRRHSSQPHAAAAASNPAHQKGASRGCHCRVARKFMSWKQWRGREATQRRKGQEAQTKKSNLGFPG